MDSATRKTVIKSLSTVVLMFLAVFVVMPPLYTLLCEVTGLRKVGGAYEAVDIAVDDSREITVQFVATHNDAMPWEFRPETFRVTVHPGERVVINYLARNNSDKPMVAQAVPSIMPFAAVSYFHKIECFCFNRQPLAPGESAELGLEFFVDQDLPKQVTNIVLSYTLFDITAQDQQPSVSVQTSANIQASAKAQTPVNNY